VVLPSGRCPHGAERREVQVVDAREGEQFVMRVRRFPVVQHAQLIVGRAMKCTFQSAME
jgi:hypothetical protein